MRVLLTGATGFIGSQVARALLDRGCQVQALIRPGADTRRLAGTLDRLTVIEGDLAKLDDHDLLRALAGARSEICLHLAWYAVPGKYLNAPENIPLVGATLALAESMLTLGCRRFIGAGTCFEYDTRLGLLSEERTPTAPASLYASAKNATFELLSARAKLASLSFAWLRFFYQHGPHEAEGRLVPAVIRPLLGGQIAEVGSGEQIRDFLHVSDVASAVATVALGSLEGPVNIGSGVPVRVREIVATLAELIGDGAAERIAYGALPARDGDPPFICADNTKLKSTGWTPEYDLRSGLASSVAWWREQR